MRCEPIDPGGYLPRCPVSVAWNGDSRSYVFDDTKKLLGIGFIIEDTEMRHILELEGTCPGRPGFDRRIQDLSPRTWVRCRQPARGERSDRAPEPADHRLRQPQPG